MLFRSIEAKYSVGLNNYKPISLKNLLSDLNRPSSELLIRQITEQSITVLNNTSSVLPIKGLDTLNIAYIEIGDGLGTEFREQMERYAPITTFSLYPNAKSDELKEILQTLSPFNLVIVGYHTLHNRPNRDFGVTPEMATFLYELNSAKTTVLSVFGTPYALDKLFNHQYFEGLVVAYDNATLTQNLTAQLLFGGVEATGRLPVSVNSIYPLGSGFDAGEIVRLRYSMPEELGISTKILSRIDSIALDAIAREATPGMQILAVKGGVVFYNKSFGGFTYIDPELAVDHLSIYDIASVTKIAATLPLIMDMYSTGQLSLDDNLGRLITFPDTSKLNSLKIRDILLHQSGLAAWIPFYQRSMTSLWPSQPVINGKFSEAYPFQLARNRFMNKHSQPSRKFYRNYPSKNFPFEVARGMYSASWINDSIFNWILSARVDKPGTYRYSDLGFILLQMAINNRLNISYEQFLNDKFYSSLGMNHTLFNPLTKFDQDRIVPTENDVYFRKQLVWGHVHDPAAAMMGGIAGHAGLFSTSNDLAKLMQMYLNGGEYGGKRYFPKETIDLFTSCVNCVNGIRQIGRAHV